MQSALLTVHCSGQSTATKQERRKFGLGSGTRLLEPFNDELQIGIIYFYIRIFKIGSHYHLSEELLNLANSQIYFSSMFFNKIFLFLIWSYEKRKQISFSVIALNVVSTALPRNSVILVTLGAGGLGAYNIRRSRHGLVCLRMEEQFRFLVF